MSAFDDEHQDDDELIVRLLWEASRRSREEAKHEPPPFDPARRPPFGRLCDWHVFRPLGGRGPERRCRNRPGH